MTIGPEQRNADFNSQQAAYQKNAAMRGDPQCTTQPRTPAETAEFVKHNPPAEHYDPMPRAHDIHRRLNDENLDLRQRLSMALKAKDAAQELLEAERQKNAALQSDLVDEKEARQISGSTVVEYIGRLKELRNVLDTEKLLRVNDAGTIADLQRRLREAEGQLKAQRLSPTLAGPAIGMMEIPAALWRERMAENAALRKTIEDQQVEILQLRAAPVTVRGEPTVARKMIVLENIELRRTIDLMAKTAAEVQDNFRLIAELASDPADEKRKEPKP